MPRKRKGIPLHGWINLNKPAGISSTQALNKVKRALNAQKIGHAGTLDPLASGILPLALGEATKTIEFCQNSLKIYQFEVTWGEFRSTDDAEGNITGTSDIRPAKDQITEIFPRFTGDIDQTPPQFSAIKINGQRAYDLARQGHEVDIQTRTVHIQSLKLLNTDQDTATFECICGKGTYIRSLARDMALALNTCGYISALKRISVAPFTLDSAISLDFFDNFDHKSASDVLLPLETVLDDIPALDLSEDEASRLKKGQKLSFISKPDIRRLDALEFKGPKDNKALARTKHGVHGIVEIAGPSVKPIKMFNI